jgi:hypothetical protein
VARIRTIKPELWSSEKFGECSARARLVFVASLNFADDEGNLDRSAKQLRAQTMPYDNGDDAEGLVTELLKAGLFIEYEVQGKFYLHIKNFQLHQKIDKPSKSRLPAYNNSPSTPRGLPENSLSSRQKKLAEGIGSGVREDQNKIKINTQRGSKRGEDARGGETETDTERIPRPRPRQGTRLPDDFALTEPRRMYAFEHQVDADSTFEAFCAYWRAKPFNATKLDWDLTWKSWVMRESKDAARAQARRQTRFEQLSSTNPAAHEDQGFG